jgi:hypothetical protein
MFESLIVTALALGAAFGIYVIVHRRLGWVEFWNPLAESAPRQFAEQLPLEDIQNDCYVLTDGSLVAGWELVGIDAEMRDADAIAYEVDALGLSLNLLDPGVETILQVRRSSDISMLVAQFERVSAPRTPERLLLKKRWRAQLQRMAESKDSQFLDTRVDLFVRAGGDKRGANPFAMIAAQLVDAMRSIRGGARFDAEAEAATLRTAYAKRLDFLRDKSRSSLGILDGTSLRPRRLGNAELDQYAKSLLWSPRSMAHAFVASRRPDPNRFVLADASRPTRRWIAEQPGMSELFPLTLRAQIGNITYEPFPDYVVADGRMIGVMRLMIVPESVYNGMLSSMRQQLQFPWCYTMRISPRLKQAELDRLRKVAERASITANTKAPGSANLDSGNLENAREAQQRYDDARDPTQQLFGVEITITYDAESHDELVQRANDLQAYWLARGDARLIREEFGADRLFREALPFGVPKRNAQLVLFTAEVTALAPIFAPWQGSREPVRVFRTATGEPWGFDPVDRHLSGAQHAICTGKTGSGKGVIWQLMVIYAALLKGDCDVLIFDSGGTYRRAAAVLGGTYFEASPDSDEALNAFYIPPAFYQLSSGEQSEFLTAHVQVGVQFVSALARPRDDQAPVWEAIVSDILSDLFRRTVPERSEVLLRHVYAALVAYHSPDNPESAQEAKRIATQLKAYMHDPVTGAPGANAKLTDRPQTFNGGTTDFLVVDFLKVASSPELLTAFIVMVNSGIFWQRVLRNKASGTGRYTRVIYDETPQYLSNKVFAKTLDRAIRQFRKFGGIVDVLTQAWSDTALEEYKQTLTPVKEQAATRVFLIHDRSDAMSKTLKADGLDALDPTIFELQRQDGIFSQAVVSQKTGMTMQYANLLIVPDALENWLTTTNPEDTSVEITYWKRYGIGTVWNLSRFELVVLLAALWPNGAKNPAVVTGVGRDHFPDDGFVRHTTDLARAELDACRRELSSAGLLRESAGIAAGDASPLVIVRDPEPVKPSVTAPPLLKRMRTLSELRSKGQI